ncbi:MAG: carboxyl transferase [Lachnospiraceae bacterium]|nr:carboxyl transferase [Lachnospiraceae bacterium]
MSNTAKMSARERIENLVDANSFVEIGGLITKRNTDFNMQEKAVPADGVITGYGIVDSNLVYIYSQDVKAMNGSVGEMHAKKIAAIYEMALKAGAPVIGLIDCAGIRVQEAVDALAGFGEIYMAKVKASGVIPQISAILGSCGGGVAISSKFSDITLMDAENGRLFVNSPNAVEGNRVEKCDTAAAAFQAEAGNVDIVCQNEAEVLTNIRTLVSMLPANAGAAAAVDTSDDSNRVLTGFDGYATDAKEALTQIADDTKFIELKAEYGKEMITGLLSLDGVTVGAIANADEGVLSTAGCKKAEQFTYFCDAFGLPIVTLTNVAEYASSMEEEKTISQAVADMTYAFASADVPRINVITGKAYGSAYVAMNSKHIGADLVLALEGAKVGVMDAKTAAQIMYEDEIAKAADTKAALEEKAEEFDKVQCDAKVAAGRGYVDNIIEGGEVRKHLIYAMQMFGMR